MNGVIVIDKPEGFTSFDVVAVVRRLTGQRKIGHTGTLDPNATGVLPLLLGAATKAQDIIPNHDKRYVAGFRLGLTTDTLDIWGKTTSQCESNASRTDIEALLPDFTGEIEQIPPMYSAVQVDGRRLYDLAREGIEIERKARRITVYELRLLDFDESEQRGTLEISCSKGTYVRTLIDDIGRKLGFGAVMTSLKRTEACGFKLEDSVSLDELKALAENGEIGTRLGSVEVFFLSCPALIVSDKQAVRFKNGGALDITRTALAKNPPENGIVFRVKSKTGDFVGLGKITNGELKYYKTF